MRAQTTLTGRLPRSIWLTRIALGLAIALVVARATMTQMLRDPFQVHPGTSPAPRGLGAGGSVLLDLLLCLPAVLVLMRSAIDRAYQISFTRVHAAGFALAAWILISTFWASDRFAAAVEATHWGAAIVLMWSVSQLVNSWARLRLIGAVCFGTLLILCAHGIVYRFVDVPDQRQSYLEHEQAIDQERGWAPDSFIAQQFKKKVMSGEVIGFSDSPNTYAMMLVLLGLIVGGLACQRISDRDEWGWPTAIIASLPAAILMLWLTRCRAALATPIIGAGLLAAAANWSDRGTLPIAWLSAIHRRAYWIAVSVVLIGIALVLGVGFSHGSLLYDSLTFRWRYWIGAMRLVVQHPMSGVGFANFGPNYLSVRLPIASEEIQDPHNFFMRILTETGIVGASLLVLWIMRLWWELTCPQIAEHKDDRPPLHPLLTALLLGGGAMLVNTLASVDFSQSGAWIALEILKRILWLALLIAGIVIADLRSTSRQILDDRPAPWLLWAILASLAVFLLHNTIEFGLFESGPLGMFVLLAGAALGVRGTAARVGATWGLAAIAIFAWLLMAAIWVAPVIFSERHAQAGDDDLQANHAEAAVGEYGSAFSGLPLRNGDYAMKCAVAQIYAADPPAQIMDCLDIAISADPLLIKGYLTRAEFRLQSPQPNADKIKRDYQTAIALNPNDVDVRTDYGQALERLGFPREAADAYHEALQKNEGLSPDEPKRLTRERVEALRRKIAFLQAD